LKGLFHTRMILGHLTLEKPGPIALKAVISRAGLEPAVLNVFLQTAALPRYTDSSHVRRARENFLP
jgi:hypothetical protein